MPLDTQSGYSMLVYATGVLQNERGWTMQQTFESKKRHLSTFVVRANKVKYAQNAGTRTMGVCECTVETVHTYGPYYCCSRSAGFWKDIYTYQHFKLEASLLVKRSRALLAMPAVHKIGFQGLASRG